MNKAPFLVLLAVFSVHAQQTPDPAKTARVEGTVVSSAGGPVRDADVQINPINARGESIGNGSSAVSDEHGKFVVEGVSPGAQIAVIASKPGFSLARYGAKSPTAPIVTFPLKAGETLKDLVLTMIPQGVLTGVVTDMDGDPLPGSRVTLLRRSYPNGIRQLSITTNAQANDIGEFRFASLAPDRYYVLVSSTHEFGKGVVALPTFYPNAADAQGASIVQVTAGEQKRLEIRIRQGKKYAVRGKVMITPNPSDPDAKITIRATPDIGASNASPLAINSPDSSAAVNADGGFELHLVSGNYTLQVTSLASNAPPISPEGGTFSSLVNPLGQTIATQSIKVADADLSGVVMTAPRSFTITGKVLVEEGTLADIATAAASLAANGRGGAIAAAANGRGANPAGAGVRVTLNPVDRSTAALSAIANADGTFTIANAHPGHYTFAQGTIPMTYIKTVRWDGSDVTGKDLDIEGGGTLEIVYHSGAVRVTGTAKNDKGELQGGAMVILWPDQPMPAFAYAGGRMASTDNKGGFAIPALRPGSYRAIALEDANGDWAWLPDLLTQFAAQAVKVEIKENTPITVAATVIPMEKVHEALDKLP